MSATGMATVGPSSSPHRDARPRLHRVGSYSRRVWFRAAHQLSRRRYRIISAESAVPAPRPTSATAMQSTFWARYGTSFNRCTGNVGDGERNFARPVRAERNGLLRRCRDFKDMCHSPSESNLCSIQPCPAAGNPVRTTPISASFADSGAGGSSWLTGSLPSSKTNS